MSGAPDDEATAWFEPLYDASRRGGEVPWDRRAAHPLLSSWADGRAAAADGLRAMVVGAGLGDDAELVASLGYRVTAFDVAPSAVELARARHPGSTVDYRVADLLDPPPAWVGGFELVVEVYTVQSLPRPMRAGAVAAVGRLVAPDGTLVVVATADDDPAREGPPWPLTPAEVDLFAEDGLEELSRLRGDVHWLVELHRPGKKLRPRQPSPSASSSSR